jgi:hypothetical protein
MVRVHHRRAADLTDWDRVDDPADEPFADDE